MQETGYETFSFYYDALTENVNYPARAAYLDGLVQKYKQSAGKVMLDLACGTGTMTEEMAERGYDMIGVDYSEGMLGQAMEKKIEKGAGSRKLTEGFCREICNSRKRLHQNPSTSFAGPPRTERSPLPCGHLPTPWGVTLFKGGCM